MSTEGNPGEWGKHWRVVLGGGAGMALLAVPTYTNGVMVIPLEEALGWTRAEIASGPVIAAILSVFMGPVVGLVVDRVGPRRIGLIGSVVTCAGIALLSQVGETLWTWWGLWLVLSIGAIMIKPMVWTSGVASFFDKSRGLALAATLCGTAVCSSLTPLITTTLVELFGWQLAYVAAAIVWGIVLLPLIFFFFDSKRDSARRERAGQSNNQKISAQPVKPEDSAVKVPWETVFSLKYFKLVGGSCAMVLATVSFVILIVPILVDKGISMQLAAGMASMVGVTTVVGRLGGGYLLDNFNANVVTAGAVMLPCFSAILILALPESMIAIFLAITLLGFAAGAEYDGVAYLITRHFGLKSFGLLFGTIGGLQAMSSGLGPMAVNFVYDQTKSYDLALYLYIPTCLIGAALFLSLGPYRKSEADD